MKSRNKSALNKRSIDVQITGQEKNPSAQRQRDQVNFHRNLQGTARTADSKLAKRIFDTIRSCMLSLKLGGGWGWAALFLLQVAGDALVLWDCTGLWFFCPCLPRVSWCPERCWEEAELRSGVCNRCSRESGTTFTENKLHICGATW